MGVVFPVFHGETFSPRCALCEPIGTDTSVAIGVTVRGFRGPAKMVTRPKVIEAEFPWVLDLKRSVPQGTIHLRGGSTAGQTALFVVEGGWF